MSVIVESLAKGALAALTVGSFAVVIAVIAPIVILVFMLVSAMMESFSGGEEVE